MLLIAGVTACLFAGVRGCFGGIVLSPSLDMAFDFYAVTWGELAVLLVVLAPLRWVARGAPGCRGFLLLLFYFFGGGVVMLVGVLLVAQLGSMRGRLVGGVLWFELGSAIRVATGLPVGATCPFAGRLLRCPRVIAGKYGTRCSSSLASPPLPCALSLLSEWSSTSWLLPGLAAGWSRVRRARLALLASLVPALSGAFAAGRARPRLPGRLLEGPRAFPACGVLVQLVAPPPVW